MYETVRHETISDELFAATAKKMQQKFDAVEVKRITAEKNNGVLWDGISIQKQGEAIAPTIYMNAYVEGIERGKLSIAEASEMIANTYKLHREDRFEIPPLAENAKERLYCVVINKTKNAELLKDTPHRDIPGTDLTLIMRYNIATNDKERASFIVKDNALGMMQMTAEEGFGQAIPNTLKDTYQIMPLSQVMIEMGAPEELFYGTDAPKMYVVKNASGFNGATGIFVDKNLRADVSEKLGGEFFIIPSSIHETICISAEDMDPEQLEGMIEEVNESHVAPEEVLADHAFYCNNKLQLSIAGADSIGETSEITDSIKATIGAHI